MASKYRLRNNMTGQESLYDVSKAGFLVAHEDHEFVAESVPFLVERRDEEGNYEGETYEKVKGSDAGRFLRENPTAKLLNREEAFHHDSKSAYGDSAAYRAVAAGMGAVDGLTFSAAGAILDWAGVPVRELKSQYPGTYASTDFLTGMAASIAATIMTGGAAGPAVGAHRATKLASLVNKLGGGTKGMAAIQRMASMSAPGLVSRGADNLAREVGERAARKKLGGDFFGGQAYNALGPLSKGDAFKVGLASRAAGVGAEAGISGAAYGMMHTESGIFAEDVSVGQALENSLTGGAYSIIGGYALLGIIGSVKPIAAGTYDAGKWVFGKGYNALTDGAIARRIDASAADGNRYYKSTQSLVNDAVEEGRRITEREEAGIPPSADREEALVRAKALLPEEERESLEKMRRSEIEAEARLAEDPYTSVTTEGRKARETHEEVIREIPQHRKDVADEVSRYNEIEKGFDPISQGTSKLTNIYSDLKQGATGTFDYRETARAQLPDDVDAPSTPLAALRWVLPEHNISGDIETQHNPIIYDLVEKVRSNLLRTNRRTRPTSDPTEEMRMFDVDHTDGAAPVVADHPEVLSSAQAWMDELWGLGDEYVDEVASMFLKFIKSAEAKTRNNESLGFQAANLYGRILHLARRRTQMGYADVPEREARRMRWNRLGPVDAPASDELNVFRLVTMMGIEFDGNSEMEAAKALLTRLSPAIKNMINREPYLAPVSTGDTDYAHGFLQSWVTGGIYDDVVRGAELTRRQPFVGRRPRMVYSQDRRGMSDEQWSAFVLDLATTQIRGGISIRNIAENEALALAGISEDALRRANYIVTGPGGVLDTSGRGSISREKMERFTRILNEKRNEELRAFREHRDALRARDEVMSSENRRIAAIRKESGNYVNPLRTARIFQKLESLGTQIKQFEDRASSPELKAQLKQIREELTELVTEDSRYRRGFGAETSETAGEFRRYSMFGMAAKNKREINAILRSRSQKKERMEQTFLKKGDDGRWAPDEKKIESHIGTPVGKSVQGQYTGHEGVRNAQAFAERQMVAKEYMEETLRAAKKLRDRKVHQAPDSHEAAAQARIVESIEAAEKEAIEGIKGLDKSRERITVNLGPALRFQDSVNPDVSSNQTMPNILAPTLLGAAGAGAGALLGPVGAFAGGVAGTAAGVGFQVFNDKLMNSTVTMQRLKNLDTLVREGRKLNSITEDYWDRFAGRKVKTDDVWSDQYGKSIKSRVGKVGRFMTLKAIAQAVSEADVDEEMDMGGLSEPLSYSEARNMGDAIMYLSKNPKARDEGFRMAMAGLVDVAPMAYEGIKANFDKYIESLAESYPQGIDRGPMLPRIPPTAQQMKTWINKVIVRENGAPEIFSRIEKRTLTKEDWQEFEDQYPETAQRIQFSAIARLSNPEVRKKMSKDRAARSMWEIILPQGDPRAHEVTILQETYDVGGDAGPVKARSGVNYKNRVESAFAGTTERLMTGRA